MRINSPVTQVEDNYPDSANILSTTDLKGAISYVNEDFIKISGFNEDELIGRSHNIVRHPDMPPAAFATFWDNLKAGKSWMGLVKNRCKNGNHYWVDAYATPITENGITKEYQSVRRKPSRNFVKRAEAIYPALKEGKIPSVLKYKISFRTKIILCALLPMLVTSSVSISLENMIFQVGVLLVGAIVSAKAVMMILKPLDSAVKKAKEIIDDPVAQYIYTGKTDDIGRILLAFKNLESETAGLIGRVADSAHDMGSKSASLSEAVETSKGHAQKQFSETEQVAAAVNEMSGSIQEVSKSAQNSSIAANNGLDEVQKRQKYCRYYRDVN